MAGVLAAGSAAGHTAGNFDYYKLALSYSPEFCIASENYNQPQCKMSWIVHGLWPQYQRGYPSNCKVDPAKVDAINKADIKSYMPSDFLIKHEWKKHGTCSGLSRSGYFDLTEKLWSGLTLPTFAEGAYTVQQIRQKIVQSNPSLSADMIELACDDNSRKPQSSDYTLDEIRICYSRQGEFMPCIEREKSCQVIDRVFIRTTE